MRSFTGLLRQYRTPLATLVVLLSAYTIGGFVGVPKLAGSAVTGYVEKTLGRKITIGELRFNPYTFEASIDGLRLTEADGTPLMGFKSLLVNADPLTSLFTRSISFAELRLVEPDVSLIVDADGSVNLARLAPPSDRTDPQKESGPLPDIRIATLAVEEGRVGVEDRSRRQPFSTQLQPIHFTLTQFRTAASHENDYRFSATSVAGERLEWQGRFTVQPLGSNGEFNIRGLQVKTIGDYLQDQLPLRLVSGSVDVGGSYRFVLQPALDVVLDVPMLTLRDFAMAPRGAGSAAPVAVREVSLDTLAFSLAQRQVSVERVIVDGAKIDLRRDADGSINLLKLAESKDGAPSNKAPDSVARAQPEPVADPAPWQIAVHHVQVKDAAIRAEDRAVTPAVRFTLAPIGVRIDGYRSDPAAVLKLDAEAGINDGGRLRANGSLKLQPLTAEIALELSGFGLTALQPYITQATNATLHAGRLGVSGDIAYAAHEKAPAQLRFRGDVKVDDFRASGSGSGESANRRDDFARWEQLAITGIDFRQAPDRLSIDRVTLAQPFGRVVINPDQTLNVTQILKKSPAAATAATADTAATAPERPASPTMPIQVRQIRIDDGTAFFADRSIEPSFSARIVKLRGSVGNLSSDPDTRATIQLDGQVDRHSPVEISGTSSMLAATRHSDIKLAFRNMELTTFNPYSGKFAGYSIAKGKLTTELSYKINERQLEAEHHVIVDQLEFGEATHSEDAVPLPIKLAVALLKDRHGVIDLALPVRGNLDDPEFRYGKLVWKVLGNLMTKIVTAPFAALGSLFGGSGEELSYIDFAAGSAELSTDASGKLGDLGKALVERPQLKLDIPAGSAEADRAALAHKALASRIPPEASDDKSRLRALEKLHKELNQQAVKFPDSVEEAPARIAYLEPLLLEKLAPDEEALRRLGQRRAQAVQDALLVNPEIAAERLFITNGRTPASGDAAAVRLELKLE